MTDYGAAKLYMLLDRIALALERIADQADGQQEQDRESFTDVFGYTWNTSRKPLSERHREEDR